MKIGGIRLNDSNYQCMRCGAVIQTEDPDQAGYLPASPFAKGIEKGSFYCQRCFRLRHYNEIPDIVVDDDVFMERLTEIGEDQAYIIHLIDIFDIEASLLTALPRYIGRNKFSLVANKMDLLPASINQDRVIRWLKKLAKDQGLKTDQVLLISSQKQQNLDALYQLIKEKLRRQNVYIVGISNVGKSTLINRLIEHFGGEKEIITTSNYPGTTLDLIRIPVTDTTAIVDTPGIIRRSQMIHYLDPQDRQVIMSKNMLKQTTFQLNSGQTIFLGGLARIDYPAGERMALTIYTSRDLYLHRTKLSQADRLYQDQLGHLLSPPRFDQAKEFPNLIAHPLKLSVGEDIAISGLGWFTSHHTVQLVLHLPKGVEFARRPSII